jgi:hypothetical protein
MALPLRLGTGMRFLLTLSLLSLLAACSSSPSDIAPKGEPPVCALPAGTECCDGDQLGTFTCDSTGTAVCSSGTRLTPSSECTTPPVRDAGTDANACALPAGFDCCDGDVEGTWTCGADGGAVCSQGTQLTPSNECRTPPPLPKDAGPDAETDAQTDAASDAPHE